MSQLLISFFNQLLTPKFSLGLLETGSGQFQWLDLQDDSGAWGCAGLARRDDRIFVLVQVGGVGRLHTYRMSDFELISKFELRHTQAVHSLLATDDGRLFGVGTGNDEVYEYLLAGEDVVEERLFWRLPGTRPEQGDQWHVNSIAHTPKGYAVTYMARTFPAENGSMEGGILLIESGQSLMTGIKAPHSLISVEDRLYLAHNPGLVSIVGGVTADVGGFARGLCVQDGSLYAGTSGHRWQSQSTKRTYIDKYEDFVMQGARVVEMDPVSLEIRRVFDLRGLGIEIYDLLPVEVDRDSSHVLPGDPVVERACALEFIAAGYHQLVEVELKV